jgi:hypothetical protein
MHDLKEGVKAGPFENIEFRVSGFEKFGLRVRRKWRTVNQRFIKIEDKHFLAMSSRRRVVDGALL